MRLCPSLSPTIESQTKRDPQKNKMTPAPLSTLNEVWPAGRWIGQTDGGRACAAGVVPRRPAAPDLHPPDLPTTTTAVTPIMPLHINKKKWPVRTIWHYDKKKGSAALSHEDIHLAGPHHVQHVEGAGGVCGWFYVVGDGLTRVRTVTDGSIYMWHNPTPMPQANQSTRAHRSRGSCPAGPRSAASRTAPARRGSRPPACIRGCVRVGGFVGGVRSVGR